MSITPAVWSAIAASFAALSSLFLMLIHRRNLLESVRPELVIVGWRRETLHAEGEKQDTITVEQLRNVGRGISLRTVIYAHHFEDSGRVTTGFANLFHVIAPGESVSVEQNIWLMWKNSDEQSTAHLPITIEIISMDVRNVRHCTIYKLLAIQPPCDHVMNVAPGLSISDRSTSSEGPCVRHTRVFISKGFRNIASRLKLRSR